MRSAEPSPGGAAGEKKLDPAHNHRKTVRLQTHAPLLLNHGFFFLFGEDFQKVAKANTAKTFSVIGRDINEVFAAAAAQRDEI